MGNIKTIAGSTGCLCAREEDFKGKSSPKSRVPKRKRFSQREKRLQQQRKPDHQQKAKASKHVRTNKKSPKFEQTQFQEFRQFTQELVLFRFVIKRRRRPNLRWQSKKMIKLLDISELHQFWSQTGSEGAWQDAKPKHEPELLQKENRTEFEH
jgi:hypothetical protein